MADDPTFRQYFASPLYTIEAPAGQPGWIGFVWVGNNPPSTLSLADSFLSGHYLFAPAAPAIPDEAAANAHANAVTAWLQNNISNPFLGYACLWLRSANGPTSAATRTNAR